MKNTTPKTTKLTGYIVPFSWDEDTVTTVSILTDDSREYVVEDMGLNGSLIENIDEYAEVTGTVGNRQGHPCITVKKFRIIDPPALFEDIEDAEWFDADWR